MTHEHDRDGSKSTAHRPHDHGHGPGGDHDDTLTYHRALEIALRGILIAKGIVTANEIRLAVEAMDQRTPANGARLVARAWLAPAFKTQLLANGSEAARDAGYGIGILKLMVIENTPTLHNMVVCTLCSCYPRMLLGLPPAWYKSQAYRRRAVREPRAVLHEFGTDLPATVEVRVHDSTADLRYMILPLRPANTGGWTEDELMTLVTRDSLIGVAPAQTPTPGSRRDEWMSGQTN